jgi:integrase
MRSHAYSLLRTIFASVPELGLLTAAMPERLRLMVTLASWCALRLGETVELRRGEIDLSAEVIRIRRAAVRTKGSYSITTPKSDAGMRDVAIPPRVLPLIEAPRETCWK